MKGFNRSAEDAFTEKKATPEQEQAFEKFYATVVSLLFSDQFVEKGAKILSDASTVVDGMARIGSAIGTRVYLQAWKENDIIEPIVVVEAGRKAMEDVAEFAKALGYESTDEEIEDAYLMAADLMRKMLQDAGAWDEDNIKREASLLRDMVPDEDIEPYQERMANSRNAIKEKLQSRGAA